MFESLVANLINNYLGDFVENLNTSQLQIGLWTGDITLSNLTIKESALADWDLPVKIQVGRIGKLVINIPWKNPYTEPMVMEVNDVYVLAVPSESVSYDSEKEEWAKQVAKQQKLALIENATDLAEEKGVSPEKHDTFVEKLSSHVFKNLQLKVNNVHLRYEDSFTNPTRPFSMGVCLKEVLFQTADEHLEPCVIQNVVAQLFKLVRIDHFSMYWNSRSHLSWGMKQESILADLKEMLKSTSNRKDSKPRLNYIVKPIFIVAHVKLNARPEQNNVMIPKVAIIAVFDEIAFCLSKDQYGDMHELTEAVDRLQKLRLYRKYRPTVPLRGHCKAWWRYAYSSMLHEVVRRRRRMWSWSHIVEHRKIMRHYRNAYIQKLKGDPLPHNVLSVLTKGEAYMDVFNILLMRQQAKLHVAKLKSEEEDDSSSISSISSLFTMGGLETQTSTTGRMASRGSKLSEAGKSDMSSISNGFEQTQTDISRPSDYEVVKILIKLKNVSVFLWNELKTKSYNAGQVMKLQLEDTYCSFRQRSAANAFILEAKVDSLIITGVPQKGIMPTVVTSQPTEREQVYSLLTLAIETNPSDISCDTSFKLKTRPLEIVYDAKTVSTLYQFFTPPESVRKKQLSNLELARFEAIKVLTKSGKKYVIDQHKHTDIYVNIMSSYIILPENGFLTHYSPLIVLDLGQLQVTSQQQNTTVSNKACERETPSIPQPSTSSMPQRDVEKPEENAYDKFNFTLSRIQLLFARPGESWLTARDAAQSVLHVLQPISILFDVSVCILSRDPRMPAVRVSGVLPSLALNVSDLRLGDIASLLWSVPLPDSWPSQEIDSDPPSVKKTSTNGTQAVAQEVTVHRKRKPHDRETVRAENVNFTDTELLFEIKEIVISVRTEEAESVKLCMKLIVESIGCCIQMKTFDMIADAYISNISLQYLDRIMSDTLSKQLINVKAVGGPVITLVHTPVFKKVLTIRYLQAQKNHPQFSTVYGNTKAKLNISVSQLYLLLHLEALDTLMKLARMLSSSPKRQRQPRKSFASLLEARQIIHVSYFNSKQTGMTRNHSDSGIVDIKIKTNLHHLSAGVCNDTNLFIHVHSKDISFTIEVDKEHMTIMTVLKEMKILDPDPEILYQTIVHVEESDAFKAIVVLYSEDSWRENTLDLSCVDYTVNINTKGIKVVYATKFMNTVFNCWDDIQRILYNSPRNTENTVVDNENASRIGLNIQAEKVVVMLPANYSLSLRCFILDLHHLSIVNTFKAGDTRSYSGCLAVLDLMQVVTSSLQVNVAVVEKDGSQMAKCRLIEPQPMSMIVQRNLSAQWHHKEPDLKVTGTLGHFIIRLNKCDYDTFWQVINELLYEDTGSSNKCTKNINGTDYATETNTSLQPTWLKINIQFKRATICFYSGDSCVQPGSYSYIAQKALFKFDIGQISVDHSSFRDGSTLSNVTMVNVIVDDMRTAKQSGMTRMIERSTMCKKKTSVLFAITYSQNTQLETRMRLLFSDMCLCVCPDFLTTVWNFIASSEQDSPGGSTDTFDVTDIDLAVSLPKTQSSEQDQGTFDMHVDIDVPEIVFIENWNKKTSIVFVVNMLMSYQLLQTVDEETMEARVSDLKMFFSTFDQRSSYQVEVLPSCSVNIHCKTKYSESTYIDAQTDALALYLSPLVARSLSNVIQGLYLSTSLINESTKLSTSHSDNGAALDNLWEEKPIKDCYFWFLKRAENYSVDQTIQSKTTSSASEKSNELLEEKLCLKMPLLVIRLEGNVGNCTIPFLIAGCSVVAQINDWSSQLSIKGDLELEMSYYNESLAVWEPLIEPIIGERETRWKIFFDVQTNEDKSDVPSEERNPETDEQVVVLPSKMVISVRSTDVLQVCLTVTCIDILSRLGKAFGDTDVMTSNTKIGTVKQLPYLFANYTEYGILLQLEAACESSAHGFIKLDAGASLPVENNHKDRPHTSNKRHHMIVTQLGVEHIRFRLETFKVTNKTTIKRVEKRLFPVGNHSQYGNWFVVCATDYILGQKIVSFHSVVRIKNELQFSVEVLVMTSRAPKVCGVAQPEQFFSLPLHTVHANPPELFFKPEQGNYHYQAAAFNWNTSMNRTVYHVYCSSAERGGTPCHFSVFFEIEHISFQLHEENTEKCYLLVLQPSVILHNRLPCSIRYKEHTLLQGDRHLLTNISAHKATFQITIPAYADSTWVGELTLQRNMPELTMLEFAAMKDRMRDLLELGVYCKLQKGSLDVSLYAPYWLINKTARTLRFRGALRQNPIVHPANEKRIVLFSYKSVLKSLKKKPDATNKKQAQLQVENSDWSEKFSLDTVGSNGTVRCSSKHKDRPGADVGVSIKLSTFSLTKIVTFTPFYMLLNTADVGVMVTENGGLEWVEVDRGECLPFWPLFLSKDIALQVKLTGTEEISGHFLINKAHTTLLRLDNRFGGIGIECIVSDLSIVTTFRTYSPGLATVHIVNHTNQFTVIVWQTGERDKNRIEVRKQRAVLYTWDNALGKRALMWSCGKKMNVKTDLSDGMDEFFANADTKVYCVSFLEGPQRILLFTEVMSVALSSQQLLNPSSVREFKQMDREINLQLQGLGLSLVNDKTQKEVAFLSITSSNTMWEQQKNNHYQPLEENDSQLLEATWQKYHYDLADGKTRSPFISLGSNVKMNVLEQTLTVPAPNLAYPSSSGSYFSRKLSMTLFRSLTIPIRRCIENGIWIQYKTSSHYTQLHVKINWLQLDNQLSHAVFPIVLCPVPPPKSISTDRKLKTFIEVSLTLKKHEHSNISQINYFKVLIQEMKVQIDQGFLFAILDIFSINKPVQREQEIMLFKEDMDMIEKSLIEVTDMTISQGNENVYDYVHFSPIKVHVSVSLHTGESKSSELIGGAVGMFLKSAGVVLTDIDDVVFKLGYFERSRLLYNQTQLIKDLSRHYASQAIKQMYVLVLGLNVLGNPFGLLRGLSEGIEDLFYEPYCGAIQGPKEFAEGLALGVRSLLGKTVGGAMGAVSRITGTLGQGLATLTLDDKYQKKRREVLRKPVSSAKEGFAKGGQGLVMGVLEGVSGIVSQPVEGALKEGVSGFVKGVGKGLLGAVTEPTAGVVDFASSSLEGIRHLAGESGKTTRIRRPRRFFKDRVIRPYDPKGAAGQFILEETDRGRYVATDDYVTHAVLENCVLLVTNNRVLMLKCGHILDTWDTVWAYAWDELRGLPIVTTDGIEFVLRQEERKFLVLKASNRKEVLLPDPGLCELIVDNIREQMKLWRQRSASIC